MAMINNYDDEEEEEQEEDEGRRKMIRKIMTIGIHIAEINAIVAQSSTNVDMVINVLVFVGGLRLTVPGHQQLECLLLN